MSQEHTTTSSDVKAPVPNGARATGLSLIDAPEIPVARPPDPAGGPPAGPAPIPFTPPAEDTAEIPAPHLCPDDSEAIPGADGMTLPQAIFAILVNRRSVAWNISLICGELRRVGKSATRAAVGLALLEMEAEIARTPYAPFRLRRYGPAWVLEPVCAAAAALMLMDIERPARLDVRQTDVLATILALHEVAPPSRTAIAERVRFDPVRELRYLVGQGLIYAMPGWHYERWLPVEVRVCRRFGYRSLADIPIVQEMREATRAGAKPAEIDHARSEADRELRHLARIGIGPGIDPDAPPSDDGRDIPVAPITDPDEGLTIQKSSPETEGGGVLRKLSELE